MTVQQAAMAYAQTSGASEDTIPLDCLAPLLAGARARGVADAFQMMGLAAVFLDADGVVVHVNPAAARMMGSVLAIASQHVVCGTSSANRIMQDTISAVLRGQSSTAVAVCDEGGQPCLTVDAIVAPGDEPAQLLKAVLLLRAWVPDMVYGGVSAEAAGAPH